MEDVNKDLIPSKAQQEAGGGEDSKKWTELFTGYFK
jgi:hypothetical protein